MVFNKKAPRKGRPFFSKMLGLKRALGQGN